MRLAAALLCPSLTCSYGVHMTYCNALKLFSSASKSDSGSADRLRMLLTRLDHPERSLSVIPVVGDKGKSSVVRMLSLMMAASGIVVSAVTYPCLHTPKDNIFLNDKSLSNEAFVINAARLSEAIRAIKATENDITFTQNELLFCLALCAGREIGARWMILEIPSASFSPLSVVRFSFPLTVITSCGAEVGPSVTGMLRRGLTEAVSARLPFTSSYSAISGACARAGCRLTVPVFSAINILESSLRRTVFTYRGIQYSIPLYGEYAISNALCALESAAALRRLGCPITEDGERTGLLFATIPARGEILSCSPTILVDAACDEFSEEALITLLSKKGTAIGGSITLCIESSAVPSPAFSRLSSLGFLLKEAVEVPVGKENSIATRLIKNAAKDDLILAYGALPFAFTMRTEFLKALRCM